MSGSTGSGPTPNRSRPFVDLRAFNEQLPVELYGSTHSSERRGDEVIAQAVLDELADVVGLLVKMASTTMEMA
jgi:hypothetical protein